VLEALTNELPDPRRAGPASCRIGAGDGSSHPHVSFQVIAQLVRDASRDRSPWREFRLGIETCVGEKSRDQLISELGCQLISDQVLRDRLTAIPCPYGDGKASERLRRLLPGDQRSPGPR